MNDVKSAEARRQGRFKGRPGKASFNRGIAALAVAAGGYLLGFLLPLAIGSGGYGGGRMLFLPLGGITSLVLAVIAITIGRKVLKFERGMNEIQRRRLGAFMDVEGEKRLASIGIVLGVAAIVANPLIGFLIYAIARP